MCSSDLSLLFGAISIATVGLAFVTNPGRPAYLNYAASQFDDRFGSLCQGLELPGFLEQFQDSAQQACEGLREGSDDLELVETAIDSVTDRQNYGVFSIYETKAPQGSIKTIGAFGQFVSLPGK